jgi:LysR family hydrogen peroxide-inducible transcriptional activator
MHQLRYFLAAIRTGSFSRAAEECHVSQPSLSQQILKLEEELGEPLFERLPRGVAMTPAAHLLQPAATRILEEAEDARRLVRQARGEVRGRVTVGVLPTIAPYFLPGLLRAFAARFPQAEVLVQEDTTARLLMLIDNAEVDMAILSLPVEAPFLAIRPLFDDELLLAMPPSHPLAEAPEVSLTDLRSEEFILLADGHCLADQAQDLCQQTAGFSPKVACRSAQMETVLSLIRAGLGISLVPRLAQQAHAAEGLRLRPLSPPLHRRIALAWRKNRHFCLVARAFQQCVEKARCVRNGPPQFAAENQELRLIG